MSNRNKKLFVQDASEFFDADSMELLACYRGTIVTHDFDFDQVAAARVQFMKDHPAYQPAPFDYERAR